MDIIRQSATIFLFFLAIASAHADPPDPPPGKVWVLNHEMSDEFNASSPDIQKWSVFDKANSWNRTAAFDKRVHEAVKDPNSDNYYLAMNPMWYYEDERFTGSSGRTYYFAGGGMDTRKMQTYGYFEVRIKPSDFPMGSGVFMNSRSLSSQICNEKYATELDIIENMGYTGPGAGTWNNTQHVNSHAKPYSDASGSCQPLPYESENSGVSGKPLADPLGFNVVGLWWKNDSTAEFYNNNQYFGTITPRRKFNLPMPIIIVMETYVWGDDDNNATNPKPEEWMFEDDFRTKEQRAVMYDWVRVWKLVDIDESKLNNSIDNVQGLNDTLTEYPTNKLTSTILYSATTARQVLAVLYDPSGNKLTESTINAKAGVKSIFAEFELADELSIGDGYTIVYNISDGSAVLASDTTIVNVVSKPLTKQLWRDGIPTSLPPGQTSYDIDVKYEADTNCTLVIEIRKPDGSWFGGGNTNVAPGDGVAKVHVTPSGPLAKGTNYFYKIYMYRQGYDWRDPQNISITPNIYFDVTDPLTPDLQLTSVPVEWMDTTSQVAVEFHYETYENGTLDIELINSLDVVVAREHRTERIGSRTLTRTLRIDSVLTPASNYEVAIAFTPDNDAFATLMDTVYNITISSSTITALWDARSVHRDMKVYPNPSNGWMHIELSARAGSLQSVEVCDIRGKSIEILRAGEKNDLTAIDVSRYQAGLYIIRAAAIDKMYTSSFIKE